MKRPRAARETDEPLVRRGEDGRVCVQACNIGFTADAQPLLLNRETAAQLRREIQVQPTVSAPVEPGQTLGTIRIYNGDSLLTEVPLTAESGVARLSWLRVTERLLRILWMGD